MHLEGEITLYLPVNQQVLMQYLSFYAVAMGQQHFLKSIIMCDLLRFCWFLFCITPFKTDSAVCIYLPKVEEHSFIFL